MTTEASGTTPERPTLAAVAALAGVSASTASLAFSGAGPVAESTRERVLAAAEQLNYAGPDPRAQSLRRGRSGIIGVVMEDRLSDAFRDPVNIAMLDGVSEELGAAGYSLLLLTDTGDNHATLAAAPVDGVIMVGCSRELDAPVTAFRQRGIPIIAIEAEPMDGVLHIDLDNRDATTRAARYLHDLGHRRVTLVTLPLEGTHATGPLTAEAIAASRVHTTIERIRGARDIYPDADGVVAAGSSVEDGLVAGRAALTADPRPTAIIAQSDLLALGVIRAAEEAGLEVPRDLSVVGFDGIRIEGFGAYDLTTMAQPSFEKGRAAGRAAVDMLTEGTAERQAFTSELRVGNTTSAPA